MIYQEFDERKDNMIYQEFDERKDNMKMFSCSYHNLPRYTTEMLDNQKEQN